MLRLVSASVPGHLQGTYTFWMCATYVSTYLADVLRRGLELELELELKY